MEGAGYVATGYGLALRSQVDVTNNNIANANTGGFQRQTLLFRNYLDPNGVSFTADYETLIDTSVGEMKATGAPFDFAILDPGEYFAVETPYGRRYTRNGNFVLSSDGILVTQANGFPVLSADGGNITISSNSGDVTINSEGFIIVGGQQVSKLGVFLLGSGRNLRIIGGDGLLEALEGVEIVPVDYPRMKHGVLEAANVSPVIEMNDLLKVSREASDISALISGLDKMQQDLMRVLAQAR